MERRIVSEIPIKEISFNEDVYPRVGYNWQTGYDYAQSMRTGAKFPLITLALFKGTKILVDGKHRLEAYKLLKVNKVKAEVFTGWGLNKIFEEAIKRNIAHGRGLSPFEKRRIALKLREMDFADNKISAIIQVPMDKLEGFVAQRLVNSITGETIKQVIVKSELKHLAGKDYKFSETNEIEQIQTPMYANNQLDLIEQVISLIENNLLNIKDQKIKERFNYLKSII